MRVAGMGFRRFGGRALVAFLDEGPQDLQGEARREEVLEGGPDYRVTGVAVPQKQ